MSAQSRPRCLIVETLGKEVVCEFPAGLLPGRSIIIRFIDSGRGDTVERYWFARDCSGVRRPDLGASESDDLIGSNDRSHQGQTCQRSTAQTSQNSAPRVLGKRQRRQWVFWTPPVTIKNFKAARLPKRPKLNCEHQPPPIVSRKPSPVPKAASGTTDRQQKKVPVAIKTHNARSSIGATAQTIQRKQSFPSKAPDKKHRSSWAARLPTASGAPQHGPRSALRLLCANTCVHDAVRPTKSTTQNAAKPIESVAQIAVEPARSVARGTAQLTGSAQKQAKSTDFVAQLAAKPTDFAAQYTARPTNCVAQILPKPAQCIALDAARPADLVARDAARCEAKSTDPGARNHARPAAAVARHIGKSADSVAREAAKPANSVTQLVIKSAHCNARDAADYLARIAARPAANSANSGGLTQVRCTDPVTPQPAKSADSVARDAAKPAYSSPARPANSARGAAKPTDAVARNQTRPPDSLTRHMASPHNNIGRDALKPASPTPRQAQARLFQEFVGQLGRVLPLDGPIEVQKVHRMVQPLGLGMPMIATFLQQLHEEGRVFWLAERGLIYAG